MKYLKFQIQPEKKQAAKPKKYCESEAFSHITISTNFFSITTPYTLTSADDDRVQSNPLHALIVFLDSYALEESNGNSVISFAAV